MAITSIFAVAGGGAIGAYSRYAIGQWAAASILGRTFFYGTLVANVLGCVLIGAFYALLSLSVPAPTGTSLWQLLLMDGLCGALTTFSTFSFESFFALRSGQIAKGVTYLAISLLLCLMGVSFGVHLVS